MEEKKDPTPPTPLKLPNKEELDRMLLQIKSTKRTITRIDFLKLLDLTEYCPFAKPSSDEKKYVAERLSRSQQALILKCLQELPEADFGIRTQITLLGIEIPISRKQSIYPRTAEEENAASSLRPGWIAPLQEVHKAVLEENKEVLHDFSEDVPSIRNIVLVGTHAEENERDRCGEEKEFGRHRPGVSLHVLHKTDGVLVRRREGLQS